MPRGILTRIFAAMMLTWLGLVITEPLTVDACPMHGAHVMHGAAPASHAKHAAPSTHGGAPKRANNHCTCIGDCSVGGSSFATVPQKAVAVPEAGISTLIGPRRANAIVSNGGLRDHTLPPANGPPTIS